MFAHMKTVYFLLQSDSNGGLMTSRMSSFQFILPSEQELLKLIRSAPAIMYIINLKLISIIITDPSPSIEMKV